MGWSSRVRIPAPENRPATREELEAGLAVMNALAARIDSDLARMRENHRRYHAAVVAHMKRLIESAKE